MSKPNYCGLDLTGIPSGCNDGMAGIKEAYYLDYNALSAVTINSGTGYVTAISVNTGETFKTVKLKVGNGDFTAVETVSDANGVTSVVSTINFVIPRWQNTTRLELQTLTKSVGIVLITLDQNGEYTIFGIDNPVLAATNTLSSGKASGDLNGFTVSLTNTSKDMPHIIDPTYSLTSILDANAWISKIL